MLLTRRAPAAALAAAAAVALGGCGLFGGDDEPERKPGPPAGYVPPPRDLPELPRGEPEAPVGVRAVEPTGAGVPAFPLAAAVRHAETTPLARNLHAKRHRMVKAGFATAERLAPLLPGAVAGLETGRELCLVVVEADIRFAAPTGRIVRFTTGYQLYDAASGNLLGVGGIPPAELPRVGKLDGVLDSGETPP